MLRKTISFGKVAYYSKRRVNEVDVELELRESKHGLVFSCCGNIWNGSKTDIVAGGQCLDTIAEYIKTPKFKEIHRLWKLYHLNDMNAGTPLQDRVIEEAKRDGRLGSRYDYSEVCEELKKMGAYEVEHEGEMYKYGHKWLFRAIPEDDLIKIRKLLAEEVA